MNNDIIKNANKVNIVNVLDYYNISINQKNACICPFHKDGLEKTPSLYVYKSTNTFWCFGCNTGRTPVNFVSLKERMSDIDAANFLNLTFNEDFYVKKENDTNDNQFYYYKINMEFADVLRNSIINNKNDEDKIKLLLKISKFFDEKINYYSSKMDKRGLEAFIKKIKEKIESI